MMLGQLSDSQPGDNVRGRGALVGGRVARRSEAQAPQGGSRVAAGGSSLARGQRQPETRNAIREISLTRRCQQHAGGNWLARSGGRRLRETMSRGTCSTHIGGQDWVTAPAKIEAVRCVFAREGVRAPVTRTLRSL